MTQTTLQTPEETTPLAIVQEQPAEPLSEEQLETVTGGLLPRGFITPVILIG